MHAFLASIATSVLLISAMPSSAESAPQRMPCHNYNEISSQLGTRYKEAPISIGMQSNGNMLQVFSSKEKDSWTILSVTPQGLGCILAAGRNWEAIQSDYGDEPET